MKFNVIKTYPIIASFIITSLGLVFSVNFLRERLWVFGFVFLVVSLTCLVLWVLFFLLRKVIIDNQGVKYVTAFKRYEMKWDEIKSIGYLSAAYKATPTIYFTTYDATERNEIHFNQPVRSLFKASNRYFKMAYREKAEKEIMKYWHYWH